MADRPFETSPLQDHRGGAGKLDDANRMVSSHEERRLSAKYSDHRMRRCASQRVFLISSRVANFIEACGQQPHSTGHTFFSDETSIKSLCPRGRSTYVSSSPLLATRTQKSSIPEKPQNVSRALTAHKRAYCFAANSRAATRRETDI